MPICPMVLLLLKQTKPVKRPLSNTKQIALRPIWPFCLKYRRNNGLGSRLHVYDCHRNSLTDCPRLIDGHIPARSSTFLSKWKFNTPGSPHQGGFFERMVKLTKSALKVVLRGQTLSWNNIATVFAEV